MTQWLWLLLTLWLPASAQEGDTSFGGLRFRDDTGIAGTPRAINDNGDILVNDLPGSRLIRADGIVTDLGSSVTAIALNNRGQILLASGPDLFLRQPDGSLEPRTYPGASRIAGYGLNNSGQVVGTADTVGSVLWDERGTPSVLRVPPSFQPFLGGRAVAINDNGEIAGSYPRGSGPETVFRGTPSGFFRDVDTAIRFPRSLGLSNTGLLFYTSLLAIIRVDVSTRIANTSGTFVYAADSSYLDPAKRVPLLLAISPNGFRFAGRYHPSGESFVAEVCSTEVRPSATEIPLEGGTVRVTVTAAEDCEWYHQGFHRRGVGEVTLTIPAASVPITTHVMIAGKDIVIRQGGGSCEYLLPGNGFWAGQAGATVDVSIMTGPDCPWTATGTEQVEVVPSSGRGPGLVRMTLKPNQSTNPAISDATVAGQQIRVVQDAVPCRRDIAFPTTLGAGSGAALLTMEARPECRAFSGTVSSWMRGGGLTQSSPTSSYALFHYDANPSNQPRTAEAATVGQVLSTIQQIAAAGDPLLVEPALGSGPRQIFRFTFAEPLAEARLSVGTACTVTFRGGLSPFAVQGTCQLNDANVTAMAGKFRTVELDLTIRERGALRVMAGAQSLGVSRWARAYWSTRHHAA